MAIRRAEARAHTVARSGVVVARRPHPQRGWALERKWDGLRAQLGVDGRSGWSLRSRPGRDRTTEFPEPAELAWTLRGHRDERDPAERLNAHLARRAG